MTASYHTLGCKVNQYESEQIRLAMENAGFRTVAFGAPADACVVNTCTVTAAADAKSRAAIRRAARSSPGALIVVTGCLSELEPGQMQAIDGVGLVVSNADKPAIAGSVAAALRSPLSTLERRSSPVETRALRSRTRAVVKVQDGCDHYCAYCIVPFARPVMSSRPLEEVMDELLNLAAQGYKEVVLAGIRLGAYHHGAHRLPGLILAAAEVKGIERIRLSSIEPWEVDGTLLDAMGHPKVCRHLHIPLQSGDDGILKAMGRPYDRKTYLRTVKTVQERVKGVGVTTDVMVGFPGETEDAFRATLGLVREAGFSRLHVFRYSPRKRTRAASMPGQVEPAAKKARSDEMIDVGREVMTAFSQSLIGQDVMVLVERESRAFKHMSGYADNYAEVLFPGDSSLKGEIVRVRVTGVDQDGRARGIAD